MSAQRFSAVVAKEEKARELTVEHLDGGRWRVVIDGRELVYDVRRVEGRAWSLVPDGGGRVFLVDVDGQGEDLNLTVAGAGVSGFPVKLTDARKALLARVAPTRESNGPQPVRVPMPGKVVKVQVQVGDVVKAGQGVVIVEAMKMENELRAGRDGKVLEVTVREGQAVDAGQTLVTIGPA